MTTLEILRAAREKVATGWCQGGIGRNWENKVCASVAISDTIKQHHKIHSGMPFSRMRSNTPLRQWLRACRALGVGAVINWNDHPERTQQQVVAKFDEAIAKLEKP